MNPKLRGGLLMLALAATVTAALWESQQPGDESSDAVEPVVRKSRSLPQLADASSPTSTSVSVERLPDMRRDLFPQQTWRRPPPPPPPPPPPVAPVAPPLPYAYQGKWKENDQISLFLTLGQKQVAAKVGDVLDSVWRVDSIQPRQVVFTYLPLNMTRTLRIGEPF